MKKLPKPQFLTLPDVSREAAAVVLGGLVIGGAIAQQFKLKLLLLGFVLYPILVAFALYFTKKGE